MTKEASPSSSSSPPETAAAAAAAAVAVDPPKALLDGSELRSCCRARWAAVGTDPGAGWPEWLMRWRDIILA